MRRMDMEDRMVLAIMRRETVEETVNALEEMMETVALDPEMVGIMMRLRETLLDMSDTELQAMNLNDAWGEYDRG